MSSAFMALSIGHDAPSAQRARLQLVEKSPARGNVRRRNPALYPSQVMQSVREQIAQAIEHGQAVAAAAGDAEITQCCAAEIWNRHAHQRLAAKIDGLERRVLRLERINGVAA